ncbi:hypothetical protein FTO70_10540 [Methanosarcina sp. KYL-1]|nr:hypothetical protein [Methanosarcina sp. KYL-1]MCQ1536108.1 hypothetical protein [Methanosarcina sp. KYL-1]
MFWSKNSIIEKVSQIPNTLKDISVDIFCGVSEDRDYLHRVDLSDKNDPEAPCVCRGQDREPNPEEELMYSCIDSNNPGEYAIHPAPYRFMLPYRITGEGAKKEFRLLAPEELKAEFPLAYSRLSEFKKLFKHDETALSSFDYGLKGCKLLQYLNTPKIIVADHYSLRASFDAAGNHIFEDSCGIILQDPSRYPYVTAALNSSIARVFSEICQRENLSSSLLTPAALRRFPIAFPDDKLIENLVTTISRYLIYIHGQMYGAVSCGFSGNGEGSRDYELMKFYGRIVNLLVLDTYLTKDLDPRFLEILGENIKPFEGSFEYESDRSLLEDLHAVKQQILDTPDFGKCRFNSEFTNILATLKNNGVW